MVYLCVQTHVSGKLKNMDKEWNNKSSMQSVEKDFLSHIIMLIEIFLKVDLWEGLRKAVVQMHVIYSVNIINIGNN